MPVSHERPTTGAVAKAVGWVTFLEVIRDRVLYNIILCCFLLFGVGLLASYLTFIRPERVILDFGLSAVAISCAMIAIFTGSSLLGKEFERRTIYVALCHPISRAQFILGKFVGLGSVIGLNWLLLSVCYLALLGITADKLTDVFSFTLFIALFLVLIQSLVIASIAIFFSTFSTTSLSAMLTIGLYLIGNNISQIKLMATKLKSPVETYLLDALATVLPNFEHFNFGTKVTYGLPASWQFVSLGILYGLFMVAMHLVLAGLLIQGREV
jgi:Cu-processing system permease protein